MKGVSGLPGSPGDPGFPGRSGNRCDHARCFAVFMCISILHQWDLFNAVRHSTDVENF